MVCKDPEGYRCIAPKRLAQPVQGPCCRPRASVAVLRLQPDLVRNHNSKIIGIVAGVLDRRPGFHARNRAVGVGQVDLDSRSGCFACA
jgi:hypothetical protein